MWSIFEKQEIILKFIRVAQKKDRIKFEMHYLKEILEINKNAACYRRIGEMRGVKKYTSSQLSTEKYVAHWQN